MTPETTLKPPSGRHAVWVYHLPMGAGDGSEQQVQALLAPRYQLAQRGIAFVASPRHADIVLLTGALTQRMLAPVQAVLAQVPEPHALVAIGDAAVSGGHFAASPDVIPNAADLLGVNVEMAGDPPTPPQIILAIEEATRLLDQVTEPDDAADASAEEDIALEDMTEDEASAETESTDAVEAEADHE